MSLETLVLLLAVFALGTYCQSVTGFGMGIIVMGVCSSLDLVPMSTAAALVSLLTLINSAISLRGNLQHIDWPAIAMVMIGILPAVIFGVLLLDYLSAREADLLQVMLGAIIVFSGLQFAVRARQLERRSSQGSFLLSGVLSGLSGGLFGMAGPPVIFHFYRQPIPLVAIRNMLLLVFALSAAARTVFVAIQGQLTAAIWTVAAFAIPMVAGVAYLVKRHPPPLSPGTMRVIVFVTMILLGLYLIATAAYSLLVTR